MCQHTFFQLLVFIRKPPTIRVGCKDTCSTQVLVRLRRLGALDREVFYTYLWRGWVEAQVICVNIRSSSYWYLSGNLQGYLVLWGEAIPVLLKFLSD